MSPYPFTLLGKGSRHDVYAFVNIPAVVKYHRRALHNEEPFKRGFDLGEKAYKALRDSTEIIKSLDSGVFIPEFRGYYPKEQEIRWHWPPGEQPTPEKMRATIEMELIPSLNMEQKKRLIKKYCPKNDHLLLINQADETTVHCICTLSLAKWSSVRELVVEDFHVRSFTPPTPILRASNDRSVIEPYLQMLTY